MSNTVIQTRIWHEEAEADNPYAARIARCHGYDVYGELVGKAHWVEMLFLLFAGEAPSPAQAALLETLAVALANPGLREPSVHAAMCGGAPGAPAAACLMAALAVGAGRVDGARDVHSALQAWQGAGAGFASLATQLAAARATTLEIWPEVQHWPGFDPNTRHAPLPVRQTLEILAAASPGPALPHLCTQRTALEDAAGNGLGFAGVAAAAYHDLGFSPDQSEMLHLLLRLPGAAAHALEQRSLGHKKFPFGGITVLSDPATPFAPDSLA